ncbi:hypothetical protein HII36_12140 [Nonomuraea sp. NN258]|uniref:condensation domain-containing protein n=1 Tax=Nonomuraea antri TaxID=2730852 RepID=UPI001568DBB4|nr:condensation domain-containing protein [Nonomuraea antri]NRQ32583.1 hypothetical protein [Nonomuraea antri]
MTEVSYTQHGIWINEQLGSGSAYHMPIVIRFDPAPAGDDLAKAVATVVERHPLLSRALQDREGVLHLVPAGRSPELEPVTGDGDWVREETVRPFDLERGPLIRFAFDGRTLLIVAHHLVFDGHSKDVLLADLAAVLDGRPLEPLPPLDHAAAQRERVSLAAEEARRFWAARWHEPGGTVVPGGTLRSRRAGAGRVHEFGLRAPELPGLTTFEVLIAAVHALLRGYGNAEAVTALDLSTRTPEENGRVGAFVNELPVFSTPDPGEPFSGFAARLRTELRRLYAHREVPLARAVPGIRPHAALAPVSISYRRGGEESPDADLLAFNHAVRGALQLQLLDGPGGLRASLRHGDELPDPARFAQDLTALLAAVAAAPDRPLGELTRALDAPAETANADVAAPAQDVAADDDPLLADIRAIWEEVLQLAPIEAHDDIFDLGGHSLTITQIIARMRKRLGVEIDLDDFFDNPTIAGVLGVIRR